DGHVTGVQTCALPISSAAGVPAVFVPVAASPSSWKRPVSCTPNTITTPAPITIVRHNSAHFPRQLPVAPTTLLVIVPRSFRLVPDVLSNPAGYPFGAGAVNGLTGRSRRHRTEVPSGRPRWTASRSDSD